MESRLTNLEVKLAFQDDLLESLNTTVAAQQLQLDLMQEELRMLYQQIKSLAPTQIETAEEEAPPPHY